jgi:hypothetical protein
MRPIASRAPGLWDALQAAQGRVDRAEAADAAHEREVADRDPADTSPDTYRSDSGAASGALSSARAEWDAAVGQANGLRGQLSTAVDAAVRVINTAKDMRFKENPKWWDIGGQFQNFVRDNKELLQKLSGALKIVSLVAGLLSFIPVLAPIMGPIALGTALLASAIDLSIYAATGEGSLKMILIDIGLNLLPGVGKLASRGLRAGAPQLMSRLNYAVRNSGAFRLATSFGNTRIGRFVTAPGRLLNRANDALVNQLSRTRAGRALVSLSERGAQRAESAFVNNRLREVDPATQARVEQYRDTLQPRTTTSTRDHILYQQRPDVAGPTEYNLSHPTDPIDLPSGKTDQWADTIDPSRAAIVDAKYSYSDYGYYTNDSPMAGTDRWQSAHDRSVAQMGDYQARIDSSGNPLERVIVTTNRESSVEYWADVMNSAGVRNGVVVVVP